MAQLSHFFYDGELIENTVVELNDDTSKHILQILRMKDGEQIMLLNGKGYVALGTILILARKITQVKIEKVDFQERKIKPLHLCVGFTKNNSRNEWMLEKVTELGVADITPLDVTRSEKTHYRGERWEKIFIAASIQSMQFYLSHLNEVCNLQGILQKYKDVPQKLIAHCIEDKGKEFILKTLKPNLETVILIGPEGDFTQEEVNLCIQNGFKSISLSQQRLRTETAAIDATVIFNTVNNVD